MRQELDFAKAELAVKGKKAALGAGMFGGAGLFGLHAVGALSACLILALSTAMVGLVAALIVGVAFGAFVVGLALIGKNKVHEGVPPVSEADRRQRDGAAGCAFAAGLFVGWLLGRR